MRMFVLTLFAAIGRALAIHGLSEIVEPFFDPAELAASKLVVLMLTVIVIELALKLAAAAWHRRSGLNRHD